MFKNLYYLGFIIGISCFSSCKNNAENADQNFKLIARNSYSMDSFNDIVVYRDNETGQPMDGYFVVGDKFQKWEEFEVKKGVLNGDYLAFHSNGTIYSHALYKNGKLHGKKKTHYQSGAVKTIETYANGTLYGTTITHYENGSVRTESKIEDEEVIESLHYNAIGEIERQMFIADGRAITQHINAGKVLRESISSTYDNFEAFKIYHDDGSLKSFIRMLRDGDQAYIIELDENENEINRIDAKKNPQKAMELMRPFEGL